jgi:glutathione S-transferase
MHAALTELNRQSQARPGEWFIGNRMTQADITTACVYTFLVDALAMNRAGVAYPGLAAISQRCEALAEFRSVKADWFPPGENT